MKHKLKFFWPFSHLIILEVLPIETLKFYLAEMLVIIEFIHKSGLIHRDVKVRLNFFSFQFLNI